MTPTTYELVQTGPVTHVRLCRPDELNTMNLAFWRELPQLFRQLDEAGEARVIVLSSTGKHFSAGMDLAVFTDPAIAANRPGNASRAGEAMRRLVLELQDVFNQIERVRMPVLAAVHGGCIGGAVDMLCACDCRYATADAFFSIKETQLAMTADVGTLQRMPHLIPHGMIRQLAYTGERLSAARAKEIGFLNEIYPDHEAMLAGVMAIAEQIAANSPLAVAGCKEMITYARDHSVADALNYIATWQAGMFSPPDMMTTFAAKAQGSEPAFEPLAPSGKRLT